MYLADGRLVYVTEHVTPGRSWTDVWVVRPGGKEPPESVLKDVQAQGPFEFSPDGQQMLFASPRSGNFDIYVVAVNAEGKEAIEGNAGNPANEARQATRVDPAATQVAARGTDSASPLSSNVTPYLIGVAALGLLWASVEGVAWTRRKRSSGR
jgi:hypothetical protein